MAGGGRLAVLGLARVRLHLTRLALGTLSAGRRAEHPRTLEPGRRQVLWPQADRCWAAVRALSLPLPQRLPLLMVPRPVRCQGPFVAPRLPQETNPHRRAAQWHGRGCRGAHSRRRREYARSAAICANCLAVLSIGCTTLRRTRPALAGRRAEHPHTLEPCQRPVSHWASARAVGLPLSQRPPVTRVLHVELCWAPLAASHLT
mmetsp:Transcript_60166/g.154926  ORF Transcript_60166/g.154926 Transcript_60166/m.154926 type:complete len:203 (+) Transcript_60166:318-926(+)